MKKIFLDLNKLDKSAAVFQQALKLKPENGELHRRLSQVMKYEQTSSHVKDMEKIISTDNVTDDQQMHLSFALGKAYEDMKSYDKAFAHWEKGNFLKRKEIKYSTEYQARLVEVVKKNFTNDLFEKFKNYGNPDKTLIFIIGMPRSCTTLVEQILSSHLKVYGAGEVDFIPHLIKKNLGDNNLHLFFEEIPNFDKDNLKKIGEEYIVKMKNISNDSDRTTDKLPINFLYVGFIKLILPKSKIVHCYRNAKDNCLSIFKNQFSSGKIKFAYDISEIVEYYNLYDDLMKYWTNFLPDFIYDIKYENLISNTETEIQNLLSNCDLDWSNDCLNFHNNKRPIKTASAVQARSKIYNSSIDSWKNYEKYLNKYFTKLKN